MEDSAIVEVFKYLESSVLKTFLSSSLDKYVHELKSFYAQGSTNEEKIIIMSLGEHTLLIDQALFSAMF